MIAGLNYEQAEAAAPAPWCRKGAVLTTAHLPNGTTNNAVFL